MMLALQVAWGRDIEAALAEAKRADKLLVLHFQLEGRPLCKAMTEETFADADVKRRLSAFVPVFVDMAARPELFDRTVGGKGALGTAVVDAALDPVSVLPGYAGAADFLRFLDAAQKGYPRLKEARAKAVDAPGLHALGDVYRDLESPRRAEACWREASGRGHGASHERLARALVLRGKNLEARAQLEAFRKAGLDAGRDRAGLTEGMILALERRHAEAVRVLDDALRSHPASEEADQMLLALGFVRHQLGEDARAIEMLESLLARFPSSPWAPEAKARIGHIRNPPPDHEH
jgi:tetratricopeptide (TPR) repeat protein